MGVRVISKLGASCTGGRKLGNEKIRELGNEENANNARNTNNTTKGNGWVGVFRRVRQVRGGIGGFGGKRRVSEGCVEVKGKK